MRPGICKNGAKQSLQIPRRCSSMQDAVHHSEDVKFRGRSRKQLLKSLADIQLIHEFVPVSLDILLARSDLVAHEQVEPLFHLFRFC